MFDSILTAADGSTSDLTITTALICTAAALGLGLIIALVYIFSGKHTKSFAVSLVLLPAVVQAVIMLASGNLGMSVAVLGTFSLVRFRSLPGTSREICCIFFAMAIGLAVGAGYLGYAALITVILSLVLFILNKLRFAEPADSERTLRMTVPENVDYTSAFNDLFEKYSGKTELVKVKTTNMGSMYELRYDIKLRDPGNEKELIDALRCRNGNLPIICARQADSGEEL